MNDLYFEINPVKKQIIDGPKELEINWNNISGLCYLSSSELYDLSWAGYNEIGFIKIDKENIDILDGYKINKQIFDIVKSKIKQSVTKDVENFENIPLNINNEYSIQLTEKYKLLLMMKYLECIENPKYSFNLITLSGVVKFDSKKYIIFYKKIQKHIQKLINIEIFLHKKIEKTTSIKELLSLKLDINCDNQIKL